ncbi:MAG: hypothetical protein J6S79_03215 [Lachnospiraceae bacterium]|nr:hypothetical protein [Lachnospiraceae bacterium]
MIKTVTVRKNQKLTPEQKRELSEAFRRPDEEDEDCPELSPEMIKAFECLIRQKKRGKA